VKDRLSDITRRLVPCLDVRDGQVVKGVRFQGLKVIGEILELAQGYAQAGADELVFYDISASPEGRSVDYRWVQRVAEIIDIPFCVAGGIRDVATAGQVLHAGADKISINSPALERPELINELVAEYGQQCIVIGVDSILDEGDWYVRQYSGDPEQIFDPERRSLDWIREVEQRGAGEIVLNCMDRDGVRQGYDIEQLIAARASTGLPLIASGGAGSMEHFQQVFEQADVDAALAASVFHTGAIAIPELKRFLRQQLIEVRDV